MTSLPIRSQVQPEHHWDLTPLFASVEDWERAVHEVEELILHILTYQGRLAESPATFLEALQAKDRVEEALQGVYFYSLMNTSVNYTDSVWQGHYDRSSALAARVFASTAFFNPEILTLPQEVLDAFFANYDPLHVYRVAITRIRKRKNHVCPPAQERLMAAIAEWSDLGSQAHSLLLFADLTFDPVLDRNGQSHTVNESTFRSLMESPDRLLRQRASQSLLSTYDHMKHTLAALFKANVQKQTFYTEVRKYDSCLERALSMDEVPLAIYHTLLQGVQNGLGALHEYMKVRKEVLGVEELTYCDLCVPLLDAVEFQFSYEEARDILLQMLAPMGERYVETVKQSFEDRWIDVYPNAGKRGGAGTFSIYRSHPYILLNFNGRLDDLFTLAHELGHAMHFVWTNDLQPYVNSNVSAFVGEVAAMVHEHLLLEFLLGYVSDEKQKHALLQHALEQGRALFFRQAMLAEFEVDMYSAYQSQRSLTAERMQKYYGELNSHYYGPYFQVEEAVQMEWARVPQLFKSFYVYKYATGYTAAVVLAEQLLTGGDEAREQYLHFLSNGSATDPAELLQEAGVDLLSVEPYDRTISLFKKRLHLLSEIVKLESK